MASVSHGNEHAGFNTSCITKMNSKLNIHHSYNENCGLNVLFKDKIGEGEGEGYLLS